MNIFELIRLANELENDFQDSSLCGLTAAIILQSEFGSSPLPSPLKNNPEHEIKFYVVSINPKGGGVESVEMLQIELITKGEGPEVAILNKIPLRHLKSEMVIAILKRVEIQPWRYEFPKRTPCGTKERMNEIIDEFQSAISEECFTGFIKSTFVQS